MPDHLISEKGLSSHSDNQLSKVQEKYKANGGGRKTQTTIFESLLWDGRGIRHFIYVASFLPHFKEEAEKKMLRFLPKKILEQG